MSLYQDRLLPWLIHLSMRNRRLLPFRERVIAAAQGQVLEIGVGSGFNLPLYADRVERVIGLDPSPKLLEMARSAAERTRLPVELMEGDAEAIPLDDKSIDTVVTTWVLCTVADPTRALADMRRVLKPNGQLLFAEHGRSSDSRVCRWQDRLTPLWKRISGGCHLNRGIAELIETSGFRIDRLETGYMKGPKPMTFMYEGSASPL